jgi:hypothetical protein
MAHFTLNGKKIGETIKIEHPTQKFTRMFQFTTQYFNNKYVISGSGKLSNNIHYSLIYVVNKDGILDTLIRLNPMSNKSELWDSFIDSQGNLTCLLLLEEDNDDINYRKIYKFNENFDTIWSYQSENVWYNLTVPHGCELQNGRLVFTYVNPVEDPFLYSIRTINTQGQVKWQYDYQWTGSNGRQVYRLKNTSKWRHYGFWDLFRTATYSKNK